MTNASLKGMLNAENPRAPKVSSEKPSPLPCKVRFLAFTIVMALAACGASGASTISANKNLVEKSYKSSWEGMIGWWGDGTLTDYSDQDDYVIEAIDEFRFPKPSSNVTMAFPGRSLTLKNAKKVLIQTKDGVTQRVADMRVVTLGRIQTAIGDSKKTNQTSYASTVLDGRLEIGDNAVAVLCSGTGCNCGFRLKSKLVGGETSVLNTVGPNAAGFEPQTIPSFFHALLEGDCAEFSGSITNGDWAILHIGSAPNSRVTVSPGEGGRSGLAALSPEVDAVMKTLHFVVGSSNARTNMLLTSVSNTGEQIGKIVVTDLVTREGTDKIFVYSDYVAPSGVTRKVPLLTMPVKTELELSDFALLPPDDYIKDARDTVRALSLEEDAGGATKTLYVTHIGLIMLATGDSLNTNIKDQYETTCGWTNGSQWSSAPEPPGSGKFYGVPSEMGLRTPRPIDSRVEMEKESVTFPGNLSVFGRLLTRQGTVNFPEGLSLCDGGMLYGHHTPRLITINGSVTIDATVIPAAACAYGTDYVSGGITNHSMMVVSDPVKGQGILRVKAQNGSAYQQGAFVLAADNPDFTGTIQIVSDPGASEGKWISPSIKRRAIFGIRHAGALGAPLAVFDPKALTIGAYSQFVLYGSLALTDVTRGIYLDTFARIETAGSKDVSEIRMTLTYAGKLRKDGPGKLLISTEPVMEGPSAKEIHVAMGTLKPGCSKAFNALPIRFGAGTHLALDLMPSDHDLKTYGLYTTETMPFVSGVFSCANEDLVADDTFTPDETNVLPLVFDYDEKNLPDTFKTGITTVPTSSADSVKALVVQAVSRLRVKGHVLKVGSEPVSDDETMTTVFVEGAHKGFVLTVR